jgi:hypothetical protein
MFDSPCKPDSNYPREPNALNRTKKKIRGRCDGRCENIIAWSGNSKVLSQDRTFAGSRDTAIFRRENIIGGQDVFKESQELRGLTLWFAEETQNSCQQSSYPIWRGEKKKTRVHIISESLLDEGILAPTQQTVGSIRHISDIYLQTEEILISSRRNGKQHKQGIVAARSVLKHKEKRNRSQESLDVFFLLKIKNRS